MTQGRSDPATSASLWEREAEIAAITQAIDELRVDKASPGAVLVFSGEAGIGKTALLSEARRIAAERGCAAWYARGGETVTSVPFNVVRQLLQPALIGLMEEEVREYLGDWYDIAGPALGLTEPGEGPVDPQAVCDGLVAVVSRLSRRSWPLVLLIDDAHWADQETLQWLSAVTGRLTEMCVLVLVARRPGEATGDGSRHLAEVASQARPVPTLRSLTPDATAGLTRATVGEHADDPFCREVWAVTGGNPYETVELLAKVQDSELEPAEGSAAELRALNRTARGRGLVARLETLGVDATRFAWAAAILHTGISVEIVARLASLSPQTAAECADLLTAARILTESSPVDRRAEDGDPELVEQLRAAAREHLAVGAPDAARRCLERALKEPPQQEVRVRVLYELGCATLLTSPATTVEYLRSALAEPGLDSSERVDAVFRLSQALLHNDQLEEAVRTVDAEAARLEPGPARMRLQAAHYMWEVIHADVELSPTHSQELSALAAACTGRDNSERALLILRGFDAVVRGESAEEVVELCDRALVNGRLAPGLGWTDSEWDIELPLMLAIAYAYADRLDRAESLYTEALRTYESAGWSGGHLALAHAYVGHGHRLRGRLREAEEALRKSLAFAERVGRGLPLHWSSTCNLVDTLLARGHVQEAWAVAEEHRFAPPYPSTVVLPDPRSVRGRLLLAVGRTKDGINELEAAEKAAAARGHHNTVIAPWGGDLARALASEDPRRAAELAVSVRRRAERLGTDTAIGEALRVEAFLATGKQAASLYAKAVTYLADSPAAYEHAAARVDYGIAIRSAAELDRGLALAESCGADGLVERARKALDQLM
ncbi:AAA ATPase domain-containing protein [Streptomyces sp. 1222.2]|uniref:AAA family ATPase n=1 Tax=Streptomyces sp. 1222.2 TaxID=1938833 RepID=UPI000BC45845|nr:AAA family ATPase [Streptomyces sp. 1222.2]SOD68162.1 AAA ATPase domain-containing protein [Streptomyces sp. 1222.2]